MDPHPFVEAAQELRQRFISLVEMLSGIRALSSLEGRPKSEHDLLGRALKVLIQYQDLERCSIFLLHEGRLVCAVGRSWSDHMYTYESCPESFPYAFRLGEGIVGQAAQERMLIHSKDCALDERCLPLEDKTAPGSIIAVPIMADGQVLGVLNVSHPDPEFFHPWHNHILLVFSNTLGQMLINYRLLSRMEDEVNERTRQLKKALQEAQELKLRYEQLSIVDDLTRLHNRRFFFPEANAELSRAIRNRESFSLMIIDLDHFKQINDTYGHNMGDEVLKGVAAVLSNHTRDGDILARFGGEEFVMALPTTSRQGARQLAERIRSAVGRLEWQVNGDIVKVTLSMGISCFAPSLLVALDKGEAPPKAALDTLLKEADIALYYAKTHGRNQIRVYQELPEDFHPL
jgi:diguanylate cyclase (GGDEF)-like protein